MDVRVDLNHVRAKSHERRKNDVHEPLRIGQLGPAIDGPAGGYDKIFRMPLDEWLESGLPERREFAS